MTGTSARGTMKVLRIHGVDDIRVDEMPLPDVRAGEVLLKVEACGICGSDLGYVAQGLRRPDGAPLPLGHEAAGVIVDAGHGVDAFAVGDRVVVNPMARRDNIIGNGGSEGAFADYLLIRSPGDQLLPMPAGLPAESAATAEPLAVALHAINRAALRPADRVTILGAGPIGLAATFWLSRRGFEEIAIVDRSQARLDRARALGAGHLVDASRVDLGEALAACHGSGAPLFGRPTVGSDIFFDMAGAPALLDRILGFGKSGSRILLTALYKGAVPLDLRALLLREMSIVSATGYPAEFAEALAALSGAGDALDPYVSDRFPFDDVVAAFRAARDPASGKVMVVFD